MGTFMDKIHIRFERDTSLQHLEVVVRAPEEDKRARQWMDRLRELTQNTLTVFDEYGNVYALPAPEVVLVSVSGKIVTVHTMNRDFYAKTSLLKLEQELHGFLRISRYELVNLKMVSRYSFSSSGELRLELRDGSCAHVSRRCIPPIRRALAGKE